MLTNRRIVRIQWGDCDAAGIVYYPRYFAMFDDSAHALFEAAGWKLTDLQREFDMLGVPMVDTRARFLLASSFSDDIVIESRITTFRTSSFDLEHKVYKPGRDGDALAIEATETRVWSGRHPEQPNRLKSKPVPAAVIERMSGGS